MWSGFWIDHECWTPKRRTRIADDNIRTFEDTVRFETSFFFQFPHCCSLGRFSFVNQSFVGYSRDKDRGPVLKRIHLREVLWVLVRLDFWRCSIAIYRRQIFQREAWIAQWLRWTRGMRSFSNRWEPVQIQLERELYHQCFSKGCAYHRRRKICVSCAQHTPTISVYNN